MPTATRPRRPHRAAAVLVLVAAVAATTAVPGLARTRASLVLPFDGDGSEVAVAPTAVRAPDGTAELDVSLGADAPGDVVVRPRLVLPAVAPDGTVTVGADEAPGTVTRGSRLRPGEQLRVTVSDLVAPTLLVAEVTAPDGTAAGTAPAALVLVGPVGDPPTITLRTVGDGVETTVTVSTPMLVSIEGRGASPTVFPDRLVLPDAPLVLTTPASGWPLPTEVRVTDETGRTVVASTGTTALVALALVLLAAAGMALLLVRRRHRRRDELSA